MVKIFGDKCRVRVEGVKLWSENGEPVLDGGGINQIFANWETPSPAGKNNAMHHRNIFHPSDRPRNPRFYNKSLLVHARLNPTINSKSMHNLQDTI